MRGRSDLSLAAARTERLAGLLEGASSEVNVRGSCGWGFVVLFGGVLLHSGDDGGRLTAADGPNEPSEVLVQFSGVGGWQRPSAVGLARNYRQVQPR